MLRHGILTLWFFDLSWYRAVLPNLHHKLPFRRKQVVLETKYKISTKNRTSANIEDKESSIISFTRVLSLKPHLNLECKVIKAAKADHHNMKF